MKTSTLITLYLAGKILFLALFLLRLEGGRLRGKAARAVITGRTRASW